MREPPRQVASAAGVGDGMGASLGGGSVESWTGGTSIRCVEGVVTRRVVPAMMATTVAAHGGMTFQTNMFSSVKTAFEVAVIRLVKVPGMRSAK